MNKLLVQKFLENHSFEQLEEDHGVEVSFSNCGTKFSLNYNMISAKENDLLASQCRGLILSSITGKSFNNQATINPNKRLNFDKISPGETVVQSYGFDRFLNYGQGHAFDINWASSSLEIQSKLDGTCCFIYKDKFKKEWCVATRSCPEADLPIDGSPQMTFTTLFKDGVLNTTKASFEALTSHLSSNYTYVFELCSYWNRIVCQYPETQITLLGIRDLVSLKESSPLEESIRLNLPIVEKFKFTSVFDLLNWVSDQKPTEYEGVVVVDDFNRIKIKNPSYVIAHKAKSDFLRSDRSCLEAILLGRDDDLIPLLPQVMVDKIYLYKNNLNIFIKKYDDIYQNIISNLPKDYSRKDFAEKVIAAKIWKTPIFNIFSGKCKNTSEFIQQNKKDGTWHSSFLDDVISYL